MSPHDRKIAKALKLRARLGQTSGGTVVPLPNKPKWMRWHTYRKLRLEIVLLEDEIWEAERAWLSKQLGTAAS